MDIYILDNWTIGKIKAGQIINNYYYIVKELVENSIDAKSKNINIYFNIKNNQIKVTDDGIGMNENNLKLSILPHATSKFKSLDYIDYIGFRGEGLYVISIIGNINIKTKSHLQEVGYELYKNNYDTYVTQITSINKGTSITIDNIFNTLPGMNKFLSPQKDFLSVVIFLQRMALIHKNIKFNLYKNNKHYLYLFGEDYKDLIYQIFKIKEFLEINIDENDFKPNETKNNYKNIKIKIYLNRDLKHYKNKNSTLFFVNDKYVEDFGLLKIIENIFQKKFGSNHINFMLFFLYIPYEEVDYNITPNKEKVKISNLEEIKDILDNFFIQKYFPINTKNLLKEKQQDLIYNSINNWFFFKKKFVICDYNNEIYFLDIHALSERLILEKIKNINYNSQPLLEEISINLTEEEKIFFIEKEEDFKKLKFTYKLISHYLLIYEMPDFLSISELPLIINLFLKEEYHFFLHKLANFSCKNSLKAGDSINEKEILEFLKLIENNNNLHYCCHGRKTFKKFTNKDLNKIFNRQ
jgi:DNA mismatch repair protein MutL